MFWRILTPLAFTVLAASVVLAQQPPTTDRTGGPAGDWQAIKTNDSSINTSTGAGVSLAASGLPSGRTPITLVTKGSGTLPQEHGQIWHQYDISPYTSRITTTEHPERAVIDWILRETGTEIWFSEPFGILNANRNTLYVYHTREMHGLIGDVVDRFLVDCVDGREAEPYAFSLRLVTIASPNWRTAAMPLLQPVDVKAAGVDAWLVSKENAAVLIGQLQKRTDYRDHNSPNVLIANGQSHTISRTTPRNYVRTVRMRRDVWPGHELDMGQIQEGYSLQISPLMSLDGNTIDAAVRCHIDQVEKLVPVPVDVPSLGGGPQRVQIQVPQVVSWRLHERFRWPASQVMLLSCGVVASPTGERTGPLGLPIPAVPGLALTNSPGRADALLFIECKGKESQTLLEARRDFRDGNPNFSGRY